MIQIDFVKDIIHRIEQIGISYTITGSVASNYYGIPRLTHDVDIVVALSESHINSVVKIFSQNYYVSEIAIRDAIVHDSMFNIIDAKRGLKADFWILTLEEFSQVLFNRRRRVELAEGFGAYVASAEDIILHKLLWHKITPSERQLRDVAGIISVQKDNLDLEYMKNWAEKNSTLDLLEEALQEQWLK